MAGMLPTTSGLLEQDQDPLVLRVCKSPDPLVLRDCECPVVAGSTVPTCMTGALEPATCSGPADVGRLYLFDSCYVLAARGNGGSEYSLAMMPCIMRGYAEWTYPARVRDGMTNPYATAGSSGQDSGISEAMHSVYLEWDCHP